MAAACHAHVAGVGVLADVVKRAELVGERPCLLFGEPHQRGADVKWVVHGEVKRYVHGFDEHVAAVGIAGKIGFAHAGVEAADALRFGVDGGVEQKQRVAPVHKGVGRAACLSDGCAAVHQRVMRDAADVRQIQHGVRHA